MGRAFYRRRLAVLEHLKSGLITIFDDGLHDIMCMKAQHQVGNGSAIPPGVWIGSSNSLWLETGRCVPERMIRRRMAKLESIGWIKRWIKQGKHGDYPILLSRLFVRDQDGNDFSINAEATTDWRHPVLVPVDNPRRDVTVKRPRDDRDVTDHHIDRRLKDVNTSSPSEKEACLQAVKPLAELLAQRILENNPKSELKRDQIRENRIRTWGIELERMVRLDEWTVQEIQQLIEFSQADQFWRTNILSAGKLREKRDQLKLKMEQRGGANGTSSGSGSNSRAGKRPGPFIPAALRKPIPATPNALRRPTAG